MPAGPAGQLAHPLPTHRDIPHNPHGRKLANLGLEVAQFLLGPYISGTNRRVNVTDPNSFSGNRKWCFFSLFRCKSNPFEGVNRGPAENKLWQT